MKFIVAKESNMIELLAPSFHGATFGICIQCPDRKRFKDGRFIFLNSFSNIEYFKKNFPTAEWNVEILNQFEKFQQQEENNIAIKKLQSYEIDDFVFKTKPYDHQLKAFKISRNLSEYGLFFEQGCGKTKVIIDNADYLFNTGKLDVLIIIAPNGVHRNWITDELPVHCNCEYAAMAWSTNMNKEKKKEWDELKKKNILKIFSFNIETFVSEKSKQELISLLKQFRCMLAIDESQKIKNPSAKRTEFLVKIASQAKYRRILTGTPIANGAQNFYSQFKFLNPNIIGISSFYAFKAKYCIMGGWENKLIIGYKAVEELQRKVQAHSMRVLKKDCLDLPPKIYQESMFDMTAEQMKLYKQVRDEGLIMLENPNVSMMLDNVMAKLVKLRQISSGYIKDTETGKYIDIIDLKNNPRINKLLELLEEIDGKVIIWATQTQDINNIMKVLGSKAVRYDGQISTDEKEINKKLFMTDDKIRYFVANLQISTGMTLTIANTTIYYTNSYDLENREQSEDRNHRIGTKFTVNYIDLCCNRTNDKKITRALIKKKKISDFILQDPKSMFLEYEE